MEQKFINTENDSPKKKQKNIVEETKTKKILTQFLFIGAVALRLSILSMLRAERSRGKFVASQYNLTKEEKIFYRWCGELKKAFS